VPNQAIIYWVLSKQRGGPILVA